MREALGSRVRSRTTRGILDRDAANDLCLVYPRESAYLLCGGAIAYPGRIRGVGLAERRRFRGLWFPADASRGSAIVRGPRPRARRDGARRPGGGFRLVFRGRRGRGDRLPREMQARRGPRAFAGMSRAARAQAQDQGKSGATRHSGSDGSTPFDRMNRYGKWATTASRRAVIGPISSMTRSRRSASV
jgi:hypothetical protein